MKKSAVIFILTCFLITGQVGDNLSYAQDFALPAPGVMVTLSAAFNPPVLRGIKVHPDNPFRLDFILDRGDSSLSPSSLKDESSTLIKYFLASLTVPEKDLWVNLSPYEKDRIVPPSFGQTEMGRDLLAEDYILKQITASLVYPESDIGKKFWKRVYELSAKRYGTTDIPVNTFNKVWIVPQKAVVYENAKAGTAYIVESKLKVMLEQDYLSLTKHVDIRVAEGRAFPIQTDSRINRFGVGLGETRGQAPNIGKIGSQVIREIVIPELTKEVNEGGNFTQLRQVYDSLILAAWYKRKVMDSILSQVYANKNKIAGVNNDDAQEKQKIYARYLDAFKKGAYNYIKEEDYYDPQGKKQGMLPRKYFSGGVQMALDTEGRDVLQTQAAMLAGSNVSLGDRGLVIEADLAASSRDLVLRNHSNAAMNAEDIWINDLELSPNPRITALIREAQVRLKGVVRETPLVYLEGLSRMIGKKVYLKDESRQLTDSFKIRGVDNQVEAAIDRRILAIEGNPSLAKEPFFIVTQTDGNHGIAMIHAVGLIKKKYKKRYHNQPDLGAFIDNIRPVIFTIAGLPDIKINKMREELKVHDSEAKADAYGILENQYPSYAAALAAREKFIASNRSNAEYMEHGGEEIMAGHATAGLEIAQQLKELGIGDDKRVAVFVPVGAGGPVGIGAGVKLERPNTKVVIAQTRPYSALVRSLKTGAIERNADNPPPTVVIDGVPYVFEDGIAVDKPEVDALKIARHSADFGVIVDDKRNLEEAAPLLYRDLEYAYASDRIPVVVGGTTSLTAMALLDTIGPGGLKDIQEADVVILFGTEGNVSPALSEYIKNKAHALPPISEMAPGSENQGNAAMKDPGGIDLSPVNMNLQMPNTGSAIRFHLDAAMLREYQDVPGFVPVIIHIRPLTDLHSFLGVSSS